MALQKGKYLICRPINEFSWDSRFFDTDGNQRVYSFNQTLKYVFSNILLIETVIYDDWGPHCINSEVKFWCKRRILARRAISKIT